MKASMLEMIQVGQCETARKIAQLLAESRAKCSDLDKIFELVKGYLSVSVSEVSE